MKHQTPKYQRNEEHTSDHRQEIGRADDLLPMENSEVSVVKSVGLRSTLNSIHDLLETSDRASSSATAVAQQSNSPAESLLASINDLLETRLGDDAQLRHQADKNQQMMNEWMIAAAVIDRFCFIVFSLCFVIGTSVLFVITMFADQK